MTAAREERLTERVCARLGQSSSRGASRRRASALSASLLTHGLVLCAAFVLVQRSTPPVPLPDATVALEFVKAPPAASAPAAPPLSEPADAAETPPPSAKPQTAANEPHVDQAPPLPVPTPAPDITEPSAPAPSEQPAMAAEAKIEPPPVPPSAPPPAPRPVQPTKPHRAVALHLPSQSTAMTSVAAAAIAPVLPARPVAGMESDRPPVYPEAARRRGQQGRVVLQVDVSAQGTPVGVSVAQSSGFASLDDAALRAVEQWRFVPATRGGTPLRAVAEVPVRFRLTN